MGPLSFLKSVYALDTLDTRLTNSSSVPYKPGDNRQENGNGVKSDKKTQPSRWNTTEFYLYGAVILWAVTSMFWIAYTVSRPSDPRYGRYEHLLSPGWIPGRKIDNTDSQYRSFRQNLPYMGLLLAFHPLARRVWNAVVFPVASGDGSKRPQPEAANARLNQRTSFDFVFALIFLVALHGFSAAKVLVILYMNYNLAKRLPTQVVPVATWVCNISLLFANELSDGYKFKSIATSLTGAGPVDLVTDPSYLVKLGSWLDSYGGLMSRWEVLFNITILRLISFNLDYYWSLDRRNAASIEKQLDPSNLSERDRVSIPAHPEDYNFRNYVAYVIYAPLYLTGPIMSFNDYISQSRYRLSTIDTPRLVKYGFRFLMVLLCMEVVLHFDYVGAISKANPIWSSYTAAQLSILSYFNLHIIWLKLLLPWRFFRLWALTDGIDPPENMVRCVSDNYSTMSFWRSWHRSYNRWLIRYIYIPLGGTNFGSRTAAARSILTYLAVFTFVALWHDIKMRLLIWGWLIVFFMMPEVMAGYAFPRRKWESTPWAYRLLCGLGAVGNVLMMMMANLVGFAVGLDGLTTILKSIFSEFSGFTFFLTACIALFCGVQFMMEFRESERRKGLNLKF